MSPFYLFRATQHRNTLPTIWFRANADFGDKVLLRLENKVCSRLLIATPLSHTCGSRLDGVPGGFYPTSNVRIRFRNRNLYTRHSIKYTIILYCIVTIFFRTLYLAVPVHLARKYKVNRALTLFPFSLPH